MINPPEQRLAATLPTLLGEATKRYDAGLYLQALKIMEPLGPLESWRGVEECIFGGRLASNLGAPRLSHQLHTRAYRSERSHPVANYFRAATVHNQHGPLRAWRFLTRLPEFPTTDPVVRADLLAIKARILAAFRDFERANHTIESAIELAPAHAWVWCEKALILRSRDAHEAAWEAVQQALALHPFYRPAVQMAAEILLILRRDDEALVLLTEASERLESGAITAQRAFLLGEMGRHVEALASWKLGFELHPLAETPFLAWLHGNLADSYYHSGLLVEAAHHARQVETPFYEAFAGRLQPEELGKRVVLAVGFVAQHHLTCVPATLSALGAFWNVPIDHLKLAAEICYEGTSDFVERGWAEKQGFVTREFQVTWECACALIDRGVPFTLTTVETTSAHLQALVGYDPTRKTFLIRDPSQRTMVETAADQFLERYAAHGPRGMLLLPPSEVHRLDGLDLPDAPLYDCFHRLQCALARQDRPAAVEELTDLERRESGHRITWAARQRLAIYDAHPIRELEAIEALLVLFPQCALFLWSKAHLLGRLSSGKEHRRYLHELASQPKIDPVFWCEWAQELGKDARHVRFATRYLLLALRVRPVEPGFLFELGNLLWSERRFEEAAVVYRFAATSGGVDRWGWPYFLVCRHLRRFEEVLTFLRTRYESAGSASAQPARILFNALTVLDRSTEALALLEDALTRRQTDGDLLLFAADEFARVGQRERADRLLAEAKPRVAPNAWLRAKAKFADYRGDLLSALEVWRSILVEEPLAIDALRSVGRLTAETEGREAALGFFDRQVEQFPHFLPLAELQVEFMRGEALEKGERAIRRAMGRDSRNAWLKRELALNLANQRRFAEANETAQEARLIDPLNPDSSSTMGRVLEKEGRMAAAAEFYREALTLSIDQTYSMQGLFRTCSTFEEKKSATDFVRAQLIQQVIFGDALLAFREAAYSVLDPKQLLETLREALAERSDLWQAWIVTIEQLADLGEFTEALALAQQAKERFPLLPRVWFQLALVYQAVGNRDEEIEPLQHALALSPGWGVASRALSDVYDRQGRIVEAQAVLEKAIAASPLDAINHGCLAAILWKRGQGEEAVLRLRQSLRLDPDYSWAWESLKAWSMQLKMENHGVTFARELTRERAGEARTWLRLAESLPPESEAEAIEATRRAISLEPLSVMAHDQLAGLLSASGRFDEALAACSPEVFSNSRPLPLRGREAWIESQRGSVVTAIDMMRKVVADSPDYYWGWDRLADWLVSLGRHSEALEAVKMMARLAPRSAIPLGYMAELQMHMGEPHAACESFSKAFFLDPNYQYAGIQLFNQQLRTGDKNGAEQTLALLETHHPGPQTDAARVRMFCRRNQKAEALELLRQLCRVSEAHSASLGEAATAVAEAGWEPQAMKIYSKLLRDPEVNPGVGTLWAAVLAKRQYWISNHGLASLDPRSPVGRAARITLIERAAETGRQAFVKRTLRQDGAALSEDTQSWGTGGYALATLRQYKAVVQWLAGWENHPDAQPWMLFNLALALRALDRDQEAHAVSLRATAIRGDATTVRHHLLLAWDEATAGDFSAAERRLGMIPDGDGTDFLTVVRALVKAMIRVGSASPEMRAEIFEQERVILRQEAWTPQWNDATVSGIARRGIQTMAKAAKKRPYRVGSFAPAFAGFSNFSWGWFLLVFFVLNIARTCSSSSP